MTNLYFCKEKYRLGDVLLCRMKGVTSHDLMFRVLVVEVAEHDFRARKMGKLVLSDPFGEVQSDHTDDASEWADLANTKHVFV